MRVLIGIDSEDDLSVQLLNGAHVTVTNDDNDQQVTNDDIDNWPSLTELTADEVDEILEHNNQSPELSSADVSPSTSQAHDLPPMDSLSTDALHYVAGYVAYKMNRQHPDLGLISSQMTSPPVNCRTKTHMAA